MNERVTDCIKLSIYYTSSIPYSRLCWSDTLKSSPCSSLVRNLSWTSVVNRSGSKLRAYFTYDCGSNVVGIVSCLQSCPVQPGLHSQEGFRREPTHLPCSPHLATFEKFPFPLQASSTGPQPGWIIKETYFQFVMIIKYTLFDHM